MSAPRSYTVYTRATINYLLSNYKNQRMQEISLALDIPVRKLYELAERQGIQKTKRKT